MASAGESPFFEVSADVLPDGPALLPHVVVALLACIDIESMLLS